MPRAKPFREAPRRIAILSVQGGPHMVQRGIYRYARPDRPWTFRHGFPAVDEVHRAREWGVDGVIAYVSSSAVARELLKLGVPVVSTTRRFISPRIPAVAPDDRAIAAEAFSHLRDRGFRNFAFYGDDTDPISNARRKAFDELARAAGAPCRVYDPTRYGYTPAAPYSWVTSDARLTRWLNELPKPVAVMAWNDPLAFRLCDTAVKAGLKIPDSIAIVGVDNDTFTCEMGFPTLSSVSIPWEAMGHSAAAALDTLLRGGTLAPHSLDVKPDAVVVRQSTDVTAIDDPTLAEALRIIRRGACAGINVEAVVRQMSISRRKLEQRFRSQLGRTPMAEILRVRVDHAKSLLRDGSLCVYEVARQCGFRTRRQLSEVFARVVGMTPSEYRKDIPGKSG